MASTRSLAGLEGCQNVGIGSSLRESAKALPTESSDRGDLAVGVAAVFEAPPWGSDKGTCLNAEHARAYLPVAGPE